MKILFITFILATSFSYAQEKRAANYSKEALSAQFDSYLKQNSKQIDGDVESDVKALTRLKLNEATDLDLVKNALLTLVKLDDTDPSRTTTMMLSETYGRNRSLFKKAFASIKTPENKESVEEIEQLMKDFSGSGNG